MTFKDWLNEEKIENIRGVRYSRGENSLSQNFDDIIKTEMESLIKKTDSFLDSIKHDNYSELDVFTYSNSSITFKTGLVLVELYVDYHFYLKNPYVDNPNINKPDEDTWSEEYVLNQFNKFSKLPNISLISTKDISQPEAKRRRHRAMVNLEIKSVIGSFVEAYNNFYFGNHIGKNFGI